MRLWHYKLIPVLPKQQLVSQWRECIAIKRQWEKGTLKHRLVSYVVEYDKARFSNYVTYLTNEMNKRHIKFQDKYLNEIYEFCKRGDTYIYYVQNYEYPEHNDRYLKQCFYNLEEKYDRGIISKEEWEKIEELWDNFIRKKLMEENDD